MYVLSAQTSHLVLPQKQTFKSYLTITRLQHKRWFVCRHRTPPAWCFHRSARQILSEGEEQHASYLSVAAVGFRQVTNRRAMVWSFSLLGTASSQCSPTSWVTRSRRRSLGSSCWSSGWALVKQDSNLRPCLAKSRSSSRTTNLRVWLWEDQSTFFLKRWLSWCHHPNVANPPSKVLSDLSYASAPLEAALHLRRGGATASFTSVGDSTMQTSSLSMKSWLWSEPCSVYRWKEITWHGVTVDLSFIVFPPHIPSNHVKCKVAGCSHSKTWHCATATIFTFLFHPAIIQVSLKVYIVVLVWTNLLR